MKQRYVSPDMAIIPCDTENLSGCQNMTDAEFKLALEECGYVFRKRYRANCNYIYKKIADMDVLLSIGDNIADFNGYVELNASSLCLWELLQEGCTLTQMEQRLEERFGIAHAKAVEDVLDFVTELLEHNMVEIY